jgi:hypothetical protein
MVGPAFPRFLGRRIAGLAPRRTMLDLPPIRSEALLPVQAASAASRVSAAPAPSPWRFGLKALFGMMAVASVQFAAMNYFGVLGGLVLGMVLCATAFTLILLVGIVMTGEWARVLPQLDALIVRLMLALVVLITGTMLAGGGLAVWETVARIRLERSIESRLGMTVDEVPLVHGTEVVWGLAITGLSAGKPAHAAGLTTSDVILLSGTADELLARLDRERGKSIDLNIATGATSQSVQNCPQRSVTIDIPP